MTEISNSEKIQNAISVSVSFVYEFAMYIVNYINDTDFLLPLDE